MFTTTFGARLSGYFRKELIQVLKMQRNCSSEASEYKTLKVTTPRDFVAHVELNRPQKLNAMNTDFWREMRECFSKLALDTDCRAVVVSANGKHYTSGLDFTDNADVNFQELQSPEVDAARKAFTLRPIILHLQEAFNVIEKCPKPVIAAVHGGCFGGGVDMVSACDIRYCSSDAFFCIKEVDIGLAADLGTLQRFPKLIGNDSLARELAYTARKLFSDEAKEIGFVSRIFPDREKLVEGALDLASTIAAKSPVAVQSTKISLVYSRDHSVPDGLEHVRNWNQGMLQSEDVMKSVIANMNKETAVYSKL